MQVLLLLVTACCFGPQLISAKEIELESDARYRNILVTIDERLPEDWQMVEEIKAAFSSASRQLLIATSFNDPSLAFGDVRILVPQSWNSSRVDGVATWEAQDVGHFRVSNGSSSTIPNTVQPAACGKPGLFVNLHPTHIRQTAADAFGKQLVHEFAKLRYGVFNEFNEADGPHAYLHKGSLNPVACARGIQGKFANLETGGPCRVDRETLELEPDCRFVPDEQQTAVASLMFATYIDSVNQFCDSDKDNDDVDHNKEAPNPHNRRCRNKSVRYVLRKHKDFKRSFDVVETDPTVNFTVLQPRPDRQIVLVMDVSGSMRGSPLAKLKIACKSLIQYLLEDGIGCGLVSFSATAKRLRSVTTFNSSKVRDDFWKAVRSLNAGGNTAIGDALALGMEMLGTDLRNLSKSNSGYIVLLSDGKENTHSRYTFNQAIELVKRTSIIVDTIAFGNQADKRLADLSRDTGGKSYFVSFNSGASDLNEAMADLVRDRVKVQQKPIDVYSSTVNPGFTQQIQIDATVAKSGTFTLSSTTVNEIASAELQLQSPSGKIYDKSDTDIYEKDTQNGIITVSFTDAIEAGTWNVTEIGSTRTRRSAYTSKLSLTVSTKPATDTPLILDGWLSDSRVDLNAESEIEVYATLVQGSQLITEAKITVIVEADTGVVAEFDLRDDGAGADITKDDGVFTGLVPINSVMVTQEYNVRLLCQSPVSRVAPAGKFEIVSIDINSLQRIPPSNVEDLSTRINLVKQLVTLSWTAVGDKRMEGKASSYRFYACETLEELANSTSRQVCEVKNVTVTPLAAGSKQQLNLTSQQLGNPTSTIVIGVLAVNRADVSSEISNEVTVQFTIPENVEEIESGGEEGPAAVTIILIVVGAVLGIGLIIGVVLFGLKRAKVI